MEPDGKLVWTYFEALVPERLPKSLLVIGSGAIGIEFASFYRTLGAEVTVVEVLPQILPDEVLLYVLVVPVMLGLAFITARLTRFRYGGFLPGSMRNWFLEREARRDE